MWRRGLATTGGPPGVVVIGGSAGGIEPLAQVVAGLPESFPAAVLVVVHLPPDSHSYLPEILSHAGPLTASAARDAERLEGGRVYVGPPGFHMLVQDGRVRLSRGPRENGYRPSIDALFRSAARWHGPNVTGVLLSGALSDGVNGLAEIKRQGGTAIVQDPSDALFASMPAGAIERVDVDFSRPAAEIGALLRSLFGERAEDTTTDGVVTPSQRVKDPMEDVEAGIPSVFACPDCGGVLWEVQEGEIVRYRCRIGHKYSVDGLDERQQIHLEDALWSALRALDENAELSARLAERSKRRGLTAAARRLEARAEASRAQSELVRAAIERFGGGEDPVPEPLRGEIELDEERRQAGE